jgi:hypothetical protein
MTMYKGTRVRELAEARVNLRTALNAQDKFLVSLEMDEVRSPCDSEARQEELESDVWMARAKLQKLRNADSIDEAKERIVEQYRRDLKHQGGFIDGGYLADFKATIDELVTAVRQDA